MGHVRAITPKYEHDRVIAGFGVTTWAEDAISVFVARRPYGVKRDHLLYRFAHPSAKDGHTTVITTPFVLKEGLRLWVESTHACRTGFTDGGRKDG